MDKVILISVLCSVFSALITFFIMSVSGKKAVEKHEENCVARRDFQNIKLALAFLIQKTGGNPNDYNLMR